MGIIPFETLLTKETKGEVAFADLPYLFRRFSVRYEFSAGLVLQKKRESQPSKISSVMVCAPVTFPVRDKLNDLPGTETEVNTIANLFKEKKITSKVYLRNQANEAAVKSNTLKDYSIVHFATHGIVDETSPELSRIYLQSDSKTEDGNLFAGEIYNLEFNANLVSLSACQTGWVKSQRRRCYRFVKGTGLRRRKKYSGFILECRR
jgi:CHAT domain-containing protein